MVEKFSDYESVGFLSKEGEFEFEVTDYELKDSKNDNMMAVFNVKSDEGRAATYQSLDPKARWSENSRIKACLKLNTKEKINSFSCDYETIGNELVGKKFIGTVKEETYQKQVKVPLDDGTFEDGVEEKVSYKIVEYKEA